MLIVDVNNLPDKIKKNHKTKNKTKQTNNTKQSEKVIGPYI